jgi:hypothetical protein
MSNVALTRIKNAKDNCDMLLALRDYVEQKKIDIDKVVYQLTVYDVLVMLADRYKDEVASGKLTVEDCISVINDKMEIDWMECMQSTIECRLLDK